MDIVFENPLKALSSYDVMVVKWIDTPGDPLGEYIFGMLIEDKPQ